MDLDAGAPATTVAEDDRKTSPPSGLSLSKPDRFGTEINEDAIPPSPIISPSTFLGRTATYGKAIVAAAIEREQEQAQMLQDKLQAAENIAAKGYAYAMGTSEKEVGGGDKGDEALPTLKPGEGSPPPVQYNEGGGQ